MKILVCGDRNWTDYQLLKDTIEQLAPSLVIEGEAKGADLMARTAAYALGIEVRGFPAQWNVHGPAAGAIRNTAMLVEGQPDLVLAFFDDITQSRGTTNCLTQAHDMGIEYCLVSH